MSSTDNRCYGGTRPEKLGPATVIILEAGLPPRALPMRHDLRRHSPDGFQWGFQHGAEADSESAWPFRDAPLAASSIPSPSINAPPSMRAARDIAGIARSSSPMRAMSDGIRVAPNARSEDGGRKSEPKRPPSAPASEASASDADIPNAPPPSISIIEMVARLVSAAALSALRSFESIQNDLRCYAPIAISKSIRESTLPDYDGPAQLALALVADATGDDALALRVYQAFKVDIIAAIEEDSWLMAALSIREFAQSIGLQDKAPTRAHLPAGGKPSSHEGRKN